MLDILFFDVGAGQNVFFYPYSDPNYTLMVDCGITQDFEPVDWLIKNRLLQSNKYNLTLTNYDQDHFSGLPYLMDRCKPETICFPENISIEQLDAIKPDKTEALNAVLYVRKTYTGIVEDYNPPYIKRTFYLRLSDLDVPDLTTNNLSQMIFVSHNNTTVCIPGDLEQAGWNKMLEKPDVQKLLHATNIFVASHHGRENGYVSEIFDYCNPECIIISDKHKIYDTQEDMSEIYGTHVSGYGIMLNNSLRKILTTRADGTIRVRVNPDGSREYFTAKLAHAMAH
ncbi:MAG: hypothetical protein LBE13_12285 [Bacteroidales bacterium]|jgi:hypothetical protein|nr:hypothetical protein [Bacteroidales bacterium]